MGRFSEVLSLLGRGMRVLRHEGPSVFFNRFMREIRSWKLRPSEPVPEAGWLANASGEAVYTTVLKTDSGSLVHVSAGKKLEFGVNFAGYFTGQLGLGASARAFAKALDLAGVPHVLNNIVVQRERRRSSLKFSKRNPYAINLIHVNVGDVEAFLREKGPTYVAGRCNIGVLYWELERFPARWLPAFRVYDEVWVTSSFAAESISKVSPVPVIRMVYPLFVNANLVDRHPRRAFGLPEDHYIFLFTFDFKGVVERKNPMALLEAFKLAFEAHDKTLLVINCINAWHDPVSAQELSKSSANLKTKILMKHLPERDYLNLLNACDCYVSLHRSEGLGLGMAEAMYLGKPVIATAYSGNMDFMNANNSLLVRYHLVELDRDYGPFERGNVWAEPDVEHAAELMRWIYENRDDAKRMGERASGDVKKCMDPDAAAEKVKERLGRIYGRYLDRGREAQQA